MVRFLYLLGQVAGMYLSDGKIQTSSSPRRRSCCRNSATAAQRVIRLKNACGTEFRRQSGGLSKAKEWIPVPAR